MAQHHACIHITVKCRQFRRFFLDRRNPCQLLGGPSASAGAAMFSATVSRTFGPRSPKAAKNRADRVMKRVC